MKRLLSVLLFAACVYCLSAQTAQAWITAPGANRLMQMQATQQMQSVSNVPSGALVLSTATSYQQIDGFGWMLTQGSAKLLMQLSEAERKNILTELYSVEQGMGSSVVRIAIGASDLSESDYTYSMSYDASLSNFSLAGPDMTYLIPVLREIVQINPSVKILAVPWTAPVWMKTDTKGHGGYMGGTLSKSNYSIYALYFVRYLQAMQAEGFNIWAVSPQNEPLHDGNNPSMTFTKESEYSFVHGHLGPKLEENGFAHVKILCYDHNCDNTAFPIYVAKSKYVDGSAFHLYGGDISALSEVYRKTGKDVYFTEQYTAGNGSFAGDYSWHMQNVMLGSVNNYGRCAIEWNLVSDPTYSIHTDGGCTTCQGALTINGSAITARNVSYYIVTTMSRVVRTGAVRIAGSGASSFQSAAFRNPDGSLAVVAYNRESGAQTLTIAFEGKTLTYSVPGSGAISVLVQDAVEPLTDLRDITACAPRLDLSLPMYNVLGQRVEASYKGIVIQKNHKFYKN